MLVVAKRTSRYRCPACPACPACPVAPGDGTGVAPEDGTGVAPGDGTGVICGCNLWTYSVDGNCGIAATCPIMTPLDAKSEMQNG